MKKIKKKHLLMLCVPFVIFFSVFSIYLINKNNSEGLSYEFVVDVEDKNFRKVYLLDSDKYLIPLSVEVSNKEYLVDEIYTTISNLRDLKVEGFTSVIASDVKINKIELEDGILNIDFSKEFLTYNGDLEEKIIEALTWSVMDFEEVNGLTISVDGIKLTKMPINGLQLPNVLNKDIGINKYHDMTHDYQGSDHVVVLYEKVISNNTYYVPVTRKVIKEDSDIKTVFNALEQEVSIVSGLQKLDEVMGLNVVYNDTSVDVNLPVSYLIEDGIVDESLYEILVVTMLYNDLDVMVNFFVDEESVGVNGYFNKEEEKVNNIVFNEIDI